MVHFTYGPCHNKLSAKHTAELFQNKLLSEQTNVSALFRGFLKVKKQCICHSGRSEESRHFSLFETLRFTQGDSSGSFKTTS
jgi:hypothetical protein